MAREEGHYTIKRVDTLPKKGNSNLLYVLKTNPIEFFYRWNNPKGKYDELTVGSIGGGGAGTLQEVTDLGNITTNDININNGGLGTINLGGTTVIEKDAGEFRISEGNGVIRLNTFSGEFSVSSGLYGVSFINDDDDFAKLFGEAGEITIPQFGSIDINGFQGVRMGLPVAPTVGQILSSSDTNGNLLWIDPPTGGTALNAYSETNPGPAGNHLVTIGDVNNVYTGTQFIIDTDGEFIRAISPTGFFTDQITIGLDENVTNPFDANLNINTGIVTSIRNDFPIYNSINKQNAANNTDLVYNIVNLTEHDGAGDISQLRGMFNRVRSDGAGSPLEMIAGLNQVEYRNIGSNTVNLMSAVEAQVDITNTAGTGTVGSMVGVRGQITIDNPNVTMPLGYAGVFEIELQSGTIGDFHVVELDFDQSGGTWTSGSYLLVQTGVDLVQAEANGIKVIDSRVNLPSTFVGTVEMDKTSAEIDAASGITLVNKDWITAQGFSTGGSSNIYTANGSIPATTDREVTIPIGSTLAFINGNTEVFIYDAGFSVDSAEFAFSNITSDAFISFSDGNQMEIISENGIEIKSGTSGSTQLNLDEGLGAGSFGLVAGNNGLNAFGAGGTELIGSFGLQIRPGIAGTITPTVVGQVLTATGVSGECTWQTPAGGAGTNIGYNAATNVITSSTGFGAVIPVFTSTEDGLAPASGGGTTNFLRADGTWAAPSSGGVGGSIADGQVAFGDSSGDIQGEAGFTLESSLSTFRRLNIGQDNTQAGFLRLFGSPINSANAGIRIYTNVGDDADVEFWDMTAWDAGVSGAFRIGGGGSNAFRIDDQTYVIEALSAEIADIDSASGKALVTKEFLNDNISITEISPNSGAETLTGETFNGSPVYTQTFTGTSGTSGTYSDILLAANFNRILNVVTAEVVRADGTIQIGQNQTYTTGRYSFEVSSSGNFAIWNSDGTLFQNRPFSVTIKYTK